MKRLVASLLLVLLTAAPAVAQEAPSPGVPLPQPAPQAPPPVVTVNPQVNVNLPDDESPECSWRKVSTWWGCLTGSAKKQVSEGRDEAIQKFIGSFTSFLKTPDPFNNERVLEIWLWVGLPLSGVIVLLLAAWASAKGSVGDPHHMTKGDLVGRMMIATVGAGATIILIPFAIDLFNTAARGMAFVPLDPSLIRHGGADGTGASNIGVVDFIALLLLAPVVFVLLLLGLVRWVMVILWCIGGPAAVAAYTIVDTEDFALTYVKGFAAMLATPVVEALFLSIMWWVVITGHDIFPVSWGAWLDGLLIIILALACIVVELWALKTALGLRNYSGLKRAMRQGQHRGVVVLQNSSARSADHWETSARGRIGL